MQTIAPSPVKLINLDTPNAIWEHLDSQNEIQYFSNHFEEFKCNFKPYMISIISNFLQPWWIL